MKITWKDAVTTLSAGSAVALSVAYYNDYSWPLVSSVRWMVAIMAALAAIILILGFAFDKLSGMYWDITGVILAAFTGFITAIALTYADSGYVMTMMIAVLVIWAVSMVHHVIEHEPTQTTHRLVHA
jgi:hypothetical protein